VAAPAPASYCFYTPLFGHVTNTALRSEPTAGRFSGIGLLDTFAAKAVYKPPRAQSTPSQRWRRPPAGQGNENNNVCLFKLALDQKKQP